MKNRMTTGILFFLFLLTASGVFAAMVENSRQGLPAISVTSHPAFSLESSEQRQGLSRVLLELVSGGAFISKDPISFRGGHNLYRYADNNPMLFTDPFGLYSCKYKDLVVRVLNYYDTTPFFYGKAILNTAFNFFKTTEDGPEIRVYDFKMPGQKDLLGTVGTWPWTSRTEKVFSDFSLPNNADEFVANIVIANTNWQTTAGGSIAGRTDQDGKNQALVSGKYYAHLDPIKLGWTITHETGHILLGRKADNSYIVKYTVGPAIMTPGSWDSTEFIESNRKNILDALAKTTKP